MGNQRADRKGLKRMEDAVCLCVRREDTADACFVQMFVRACA